MVKKIIITALSVCLLSACDPPPWVRPSSVSPLTGLVPVGQLKTTRTQLTGTGQKVLAIVYSKNVEYSRTLNAQMQTKYLGWITQFNTGDIRDDVNLVLSDDVLMSNLLAPVRAAFREVRFVRDIPEGFENGADYVAVLDLDLNTTSKMVLLSQTTTNVAHASLLFIDPNLEAGPEVRSLVTSEDTLTMKGADGNIRDGVRLIKNARTKMISEFATDFASKVRR